MVSSTTPSSGEYLLEMSGINKSFPGVKALDNVNLKVRPHSIHALMGGKRRRKINIIKMPVWYLSKKTPAPFYSGVKRSISILPKKHWKMVFRWYTGELNLVLQRSVMDNMWLGRYPTKGMFVDQDKMYRETKAIF